MKAGTLIAFEGIDGSGKSTQAKLLGTALRERGRRVVETREPTDGPYGRRIRAMAMSNGPPDSDEELRWFLEDRRQHVKEVIEPALAEGAVVITDRYFLSTVAYQGARGHDPAELLAAGEAEFPVPRLVVLLDLAPTDALARARGRAADAEPAFEDRALLARVAAIYRSLDRPYIERIDARAGPETVHAQVLERIESRLRAQPDEDRP